MAKGARDWREAGALQYVILITWTKCPTHRSTFPIPTKINPIANPKPTGPKFNRPPPPPTLPALQTPQTQPPRLRHPPPLAPPRRHRRQMAARPGRHHLGQRPFIRPQPAPRPRRPLRAQNRRRRLHQLVPRHLPPLVALHRRHALQEAEP